MKKDKRKTKTQQLIKDVFISLVEERGYSKVTVRDITKKAMINRNTFYLHYLDKEDLISKIVMEVLDSQTEELEKISLDLTHIDESKLINFLYNILSIVYEEIEFYRILLIDPNLTGYFTRLNDFIKIRNTENFKMTYKSQVIFDYISSGIFGIIAKWVVNDSYPIDVMAETLAKLIITNYNSILQ